MHYLWIFVSILFLSKPSSLAINPTVNIQWTCESCIGREGSLSSTDVWVNFTVSGGKLSVETSSNEDSSNEDSSEESSSDEDSSEESSSDEDSSEESSSDEDSSEESSSDEDSSEESSSDEDSSVSKQSKERSSGQTGVCCFTCCQTIEYNSSLQIDFGSCLAKYSVISNITFEFKLPENGGGLCHCVGINFTNADEIFK